jgi:5-methylcytosine-specific restriction endonuclease McrA
MPRVHRCAESFCQTIIPISERYCKVHAPLHKPFHTQTRTDKLAANKEYNLYERDSIVNTFYHSKAWREVSNYVKSRDYYTDAISNEVLSDGALIVDHITPRRLLNRDEALNPANLWCLSRQHHNVKTKLEQSIAKQPNGDKKLQHLQREWWLKVLKEKSKPKSR